MLRIKELSDMIDIAQDTVIGEDLYYDKVNHRIMITNEDFDMDDSIAFDDDFISIQVMPFGRDMFLAFFDTITNSNVRDMFRDRFHGARKYRKVKDLLPRYHLLDAFYKFKDQYQLKIAKRWCMDHHIDYIDIDGKIIKVDSNRSD
jgi:hypothetical protein